MTQCAIEDVTAINFISGDFVGDQKWKMDKTCVCASPP